MTLKVCTKCKELKEANNDNFAFDKHNKTGFKNWCKICCKKHMDLKRGTNSKKRKTIKNEYKFCKECNQELTLDNFRIVRKTNENPYPYHICRPCEWIVQKKKEIKNPQKYKSIRRASAIKRRPIVARNAKIRYHSDPVWKLAKNIGGLTRAAFKRSGYKKDTKTSEILGCSFETFFNHMVTQLTEPMTIENHGEVWEIDHYFPVAVAIKLAKQNPSIGLDIIKKISHYTNLRPMISRENRFKRDTVPPEYLLSNGEVDLTKLLTDIS